MNQGHSRDRSGDGQSMVSKPVVIIIGVIFAVGLATFLATYRSCRPFPPKEPVSMATTTGDGQAQLLETLRDCRKLWHSEPERTVVEYVLRSAGQLISAPISEDDVVMRFAIDRSGRSPSWSVGPSANHDFDERALWKVSASSSPMVDGTAEERRGGILFSCNVGVCPPEKAFEKRVTRWHDVRIFYDFDVHP